MNPDPALLALLQAVEHLNVHDGKVDVDETQKTILVPLPYVVFYSGLGEDIDERAGGRPGGRMVPFQISYVGETREQARDAGEAARSALSRKRVTVDGRQSGLIRVVASDRIRRDDDYTSPGGAPLFHGADQYEVGSN